MLLGGNKNIFAWNTEHKKKFMFSKNVTLYSRSDHLLIPNNHEQSTEYHFFLPTNIFKDKGLDVMFAIEKCIRVTQNVSMQMRVQWGVYNKRLLLLWQYFLFLCSYSLKKTLLFLFVRLFVHHLIMLQLVSHSCIEITKKKCCILIIYRIISFKNGCVCAFLILLRKTWKYSLKILW